jgi:hypothetical protein
MMPPEYAATTFALLDGTRLARYAPQLAFPRWRAEGDHAAQRSVALARAPEGDTANCGRNARLK